MSAPNIDDKSTTYSKLSVSHLAPPPPNTSTNILLLVGSFSPITYSHLRLMICAYETLQWNGKHIAGAYISPASDGYKKPHLVSAKHRSEMIKIAIARLPWLVMDSWECSQPRMVRSYEVAERIRNEVVDHFKCDVSQVQIQLVCGHDLWQNIVSRKGWPDFSINRLVQAVSFVVAIRDEQKPEEKLLSINDFPVKISIIDGWVGQLSSTLIRNCLSNGKCIEGMTPPGVIDYIQSHQLKFQ